MNNVVRRKSLVISVVMEEQDVIYDLSIAQVESERMFLA